MEEKERVNMLPDLMAATKMLTGGMFSLSIGGSLVWASAAPAAVVCRAPTAGRASRCWPFSCETLPLFP